MSSDGRRSVNVKRVELLASLKKNLDQHLVDVAEAKLEYAKAGEAVLRKALKEFQKATSKGAIRVSMDAPADYSENYKRMIAMLEMSTDDVINISESDFQKFVLDEWEWSRAFKALTASYSGLIK